MTTTEDFELIVKKAKAYDEMMKYFNYVVSYRDGLLAHQAAGVSEKADSVKKMKYKMVKGERKLTEEERIIVVSRKIPAELRMQMQEEIQRLNGIIETISQFIIKTNSNDEDREPGKGKD